MNKGFDRDAERADAADAVFDARADTLHDVPVSGARAVRAADAAQPAIAGVGVADVLALANIRRCLRSAGATAGRCASHGKNNTADHHVRVCLRFDQRLAHAPARRLAIDDSRPAHAP